MAEDYKVWQHESDDPKDWFQGEDEFSEAPDAFKGFEKPHKGPLYSDRTNEITQAIYSEFSGVYSAIKDVQEQEFDFEQRSFFNPGYAEYRHSDKEAGIQAHLEATDKSENQALLDFEYGVGVLERLREENPDNRDYKMALTVDITTGQLVFPKYTESQLANLLRADPTTYTLNKYRSNTELLNRAFRDNPELKDLLWTPEEPGMADILGENLRTAGYLLTEGIPKFMAQTFDFAVSVNNNIAWAIDETVEFFGGDTPYVDIYDSTREGSWMRIPGDYAFALENKRIEEHNMKMQFDQKYQEMQLWLENTPLLYNLADPKAWTYTIGSVLPSMAVIYGTGGTSFQAARLLGMGVNTATRTALASMITAGTLMEGNGYLDNAITYLSSDQLTSSDEMNKDLAEYANDIRKDYHIIDAVTQNPSFPDEYKSGDELSKTVITRREYEDMVGRYAKENYTVAGMDVYKRGMDISDAIDANYLSALGYGIIAGTIEGLTASRVIKMLPGNWGQRSFRNSFIGKNTLKLEKQMRRIPGAGKFMRISEKKWMNIVTQGLIESLEEVTQYTAEAFISSGIPLTAYKPELDFKATDVFSSAVGGFFGGAIITTPIMLAQSTGVTDYFANKRAMNSKVMGEVEYYARKNKAGNWNLFYKRDGKETQLKVGDGILQEEKDEYGSFRAANKVLKGYRSDQRRLEEIGLFNAHKHMVDSKTGKIEFNEETGQYDVEIISNETGERVDVFHFETSLSAKKGKRNLDDNIKIITEADTKYSEEELSEMEVAYDSPEAKKTQETRRNTVILKSYLSNIIEGGLNKGELETEAELENEGKFDDKLPKLDTLLDALSDKDAVDNTGVTPEQIIEEVRNDFGPDIAGQIADTMLKKGPPVEEGPVTEEGPPGKEVPLKDDTAAPPDDIGVPPESDIKTAEEMSLKELRAELSEIEGRKDLSSKIRIKRLKEEIKSRKGKAKTRATVSAVNKKIIQEKIAKIRSKEAKTLMDNLVQGKEGEDLLQGIDTLDKKILDKVIGWVSKQKFMGEEWVEEALLNLQALSVIVEAQKKEQEKEAEVTEPTIDITGMVLSNLLAEVREEGRKYSREKLANRMIELGFSLDVKNLTKSQLIKLLKEEVEKAKEEPSQRYQRGVDFKSKTESRKEAVRRNIEDIISAVGDKVLLNGEKVKWKFIDDKNQGRGGYLDGVITINLAHADSTTPFHEIMHPFIESLYVQDRALFDSIFNDLIEDDLGKKVLGIVTSKKGWGLDINNPITKIEVVVEAIAQASRLKKSREGSAFMNAIRRFLQWLKSAFFPNAAHSKSYIITEKTTFKDIADMLTEYHSDSYFEVLNPADTETVIQDIVRANQNVSVSVVDKKITQESERLEVESLITGTISDLIKDKVSSSLKKDGSISPSRLQKAMKNIKQDIEDLILERFALDPSYVKDVIKLYASNDEVVKQRYRDNAKDMLWDRSIYGGILAKYKDISGILPSYSDIISDKSAWLINNIIDAVPLKYKFNNFLIDMERKNEDILITQKIGAAGKKHFQPYGITKFEADAIEDFRVKFLIPELKKQGITDKRISASIISEYYNMYMHNRYGLFMINTRGLESMIKLNNVINLPSAETISPKEYNKLEEKFREEAEELWGEELDSQEMDAYVNMRLSQHINNIIPHERLMFLSNFTHHDPDVHKLFLSPSSNVSKEYFTNANNAIGNANGIGWFAHVSDKEYVGNDIFLFEYQTDILKKLHKQLTKGNYKMTYEEFEKLIVELKSGSDKAPIGVMRDAIKEIAEGRGDIASVVSNILNDFFGLPSVNGYLSKVFYKIPRIKKITELLSEGKAIDSKEILELISVTEDEVLRAFYSRKLSTELNVKQLFLHLMESPEGRKAGIKLFDLILGRMNKQMQEIAGVNFMKMVKHLFSRTDINDTFASSWAYNPDVTEAYVAEDLVKFVTNFFSNYKYKIGDEEVFDFMINHNLISHKTSTQEGEEWGRVMSEPNRNWTESDILQAYKTEISFLEERLESKEFELVEAEESIGFQGSDRYYELVDDVAYFKARIKKFKEVQDLLNKASYGGEIGMVEYELKMTQFYANIVLSAFANHMASIEGLVNQAEVIKEIWKENANVLNLSEDGKTIGNPLLETVEDLSVLWKKWFEIIIPTSLAYAHNRKSGSIYLQTGNTNDPIQTNNNARGIYLTYEEQAVDNIKTAYQVFTYYSSADVAKGLTFQSSINKKIEGHKNRVQLQEVLKLILSENGQYKWNKAGMHETLKHGRIASDEILLSAVRELIKLTAPDVKEFKKLGGPTSKTGQWFKQLKNLEDKGIIKISYEKPSWASWQLMKVEILKPDELVPTRFQPMIEKAKDTRYNPKTEEEVYDKVENLVRYQPVELSRSNKKEARQFFEGALSDITNVLKSRGFTQIDAFDFETSMVNAIPPGPFRDYFHEWFKSKFNDHPDMKIRLAAKGSNNGLIANPEDIRGEVDALFDTEGIREGLGSIFDEGGVKESEIGINEQLWQEELGILIPEGSLKALKRKARYQVNNFEEFIEKVYPIYVHRRFKGLSPREKMMTGRFYLRINSYIKTNQPEGKGNERNNFTVIRRKDFTVEGHPEGLDIALKDGVNVKTGNQNVYADKITLAERNVKKKLIHWITDEDYFEWTKSKKKGEVWSNPYNFFDLEQLVELKEELRNFNLAIAFSRGEKRKLGLVRISDRHKEMAENMPEYLAKEVADGYIPDDEKNIDSFVNASAIAVHEGIKTFWPKYLFDDGGAANVLKRLKIPFTPITAIKNMPNYSFKIWDYEKASIVYKDTDKTVRAVYPVKGVGPKYIWDGTTLGSRNLFSMLKKYAFIPENAGSNKNVIYHTESMKTLMVKHEMMKAPRNVEIWYNKGQADEQLVAKIDNKRNITDADGNPIDLLMTPDEAKVFDGYSLDTIHSMTGESIGINNYRDAVPSQSSHGVQWYSYVDDDNIIRQFKENILPTVNTQMAEIWRYSVSDINNNNEVTKSAAEKIEELLVGILNTKDNAGYRHSVAEHSKLGAGLHQGLEPMIDKLIYTKRMNKVLAIGNQAGTRVKINSRLDLNENEIALSKYNASVVYHAYAKSQKIPILEARQTNIDIINEWLSENEIKVSMTRYPVPHKGGMVIARIIRLHERKGMADLHPIDVFAKLEADGDGDEVQLERLTPGHTKAIEDYLSGLTIEGINLDQYVSKAQKKIILTNEFEKFVLINALGYGERATGEIANVMNVYGQLLRVFDHAIIDGNKIVLKGINEKVYWKAVGKEMEVGEILRNYLQAALDNVKHLLLSEWDYDLDMLYQALFKRADGKPLGWKTYYYQGKETRVHQGRRVLNALRPLIDIHKLPGRIRRGEDFEGGSFGATDVIQKSEEFRNYTLNRFSHVRKGLFDVIISRGESNVGNLENLVFKEDALTSPLEDIAIAPVRTMEEHIVRHKRRGFEETVFKLNKILHSNAHLGSVEAIDKLQSTLIDRAYKADVKAGIAKGYKKTYLRAEDRKGSIYRTNMGNAWFQVLARIDKMGPQTIDRNDAIVEFKTKWDKKFKALSKSARVIGTIEFLKGFKNLSDQLQSKKFDKFGQVRVFKVLPPSSVSIEEIQLLDEGILKEFYKEYNKIVSNPNDTSLKNVSRLRNYTPIDESIKRICD